MNKEEVWKDVKNYEDYQVSSLGRVKSLKFGKEKILKSSITSRGYSIVGLSEYGITTSTNVHKLVAEAFLNHVPCGMDLVVDHVDNVQSNNNVDNLQIITQRENLSKNLRKGSSIYPGVSFHSLSSKWTAAIYINGEDLYLGIFITEIEAHKAYQDKLNSLNK